VERNVRVLVYGNSIQEYDIVRTYMVTYSIINWKRINWWTRLKFMNEAFDNSVGTQRSDMGLFKKFSLNLTTVALPNLIAFDLVIVYPMTAMSGYVNY